MVCNSDCVLAICLWSTGELAYRNLELIGTMPDKYQVWLGGPRVKDYDYDDGFHCPNSERATGSGLSLVERVSASEGAPANIC